MEVVEFGGWPNCIRLSNERMELIATTDVGPRIIRLGFVGGQNLFKTFDETLGQTGGDEWHSYGGHRLWVAPEDRNRTYAPDNAPVEDFFDERCGACRHHATRHAQDIVAKTVDEQRQYESDQSPGQAQQQREHGPQQQSVVGRTGHVALRFRRRGGNV